MSAIRIAQRGWCDGSGAQTADDVIAGIGVWWVEIDGVRIEGRNLTCATFTAATDEIGEATVTLHLLGAVEIVYVDKDGVPLPGAPVSTTVEALAEVGDIVAGTVIERPES